MALVFVVVFCFLNSFSLVLIAESFCPAAHPCHATSKRKKSSLPLKALFDKSVYETIQNGKIATIPNFLSVDEIAALKRDAQALHADRKFSTDALASYGQSGSFDPAKDRAVLKLAQWKDPQIGDYETRQRFAARISGLRTDLSQQLNRPRLVLGDSVNKYGVGSTEISYTRFGPGAFLARHVDEHHEELKGTAGWGKPTRRSLSWLVYLNDKDWNADRHGGCLRCYERRSSPPSHVVGARRDGDLQIGWLRPSLDDPVERPVFMDAQRAADGSSIAPTIGTGNCAMYIDNPNDARGVEYISNDFYAHPTLFVAGSELLAQKLLIPRADLKRRFHLIEPPKSIVTDWLNKQTASRLDDECIADVEPTGGTLVVFDSVSLPHEVLPTVGRERWATSGWLHEDQQPIETHPHFQK